MIILPIIIFDALPYRGINISSDDRMLPNSMLGYAPQIRGYAKTNAKVEVRLIYAELSGDFPWEILGSQFIKVFGHLIWCLKTQTLLNSSMIIK